MASKMYQFALFATLASLMLCRGATAQSSCSSTMMSLSSCLSYVTGNVSTPTQTCCTSLSDAVKSQPQCLCPLLNGSGAGSSVGLAINQTLAMALPSICSVQTPSVRDCNAVANGPAGAPAPATLSSPTDASTETEPAVTPATTTTTIPSIPAGGSRTGPNSGSTSEGSNKKSSIHLPVVSLFVFAWIANAFSF